MSVDDDDVDDDDDDELALCQKDHDKTGVTYNNLNDLLLQKGHSAFGRHQKIQIHSIYQCHCQS